MSLSAPFYVLPLPKEPSPLAAKRQRSQHLMSLPQKGDRSVSESGGSGPDAVAVPHRPAGPQAVAAVRHVTIKRDTGTTGT